MNKQAVLVVSLILVFSLAGCGQKQAEVINAISGTPIPSQTITRTPAPSPFLTITTSPTSTIVPRTIEAIGPLLVQPGELPKDYSTGKVRYGVPTFIDLKGAVCKERIYQRFIQDVKIIGWVSVARCTHGTIDQAGFSVGYDEVIWGGGSPIKISPGYLSISDQKNGREPGMDFLFFACDAMIQIRWGGDVDRDAFLSYAKSLNERLAPILCEGATPTPSPSSTPFE